MYLTFIIDEAKNEKKRRSSHAIQVEFVCEDMSENCVGVASTIPHFSRKLCELQRSFFVCNYVTYRRTFWQSIDRFYFLC